MIVLLFLFFLFAIFGLFLGSLVVGVFRNLNSWNQVYRALGKRYGGSSTNRVNPAYLFNNPGLSFNYGRTFCYLRNRKTHRFAEGTQTEATMDWPDKRIRLDISTRPTRKRTWGPGAMKQIEFDDPMFQSNFYVSSNQPLVAKKMLGGSAQWRLDQLRQLAGNSDLVVTLQRGTLSIAKPGYLKDYDLLDQFLRLSTELFDQLMLVDSEGIDFVNNDEAVIVTDVKCPICSQEIIAEMVVCNRCQTPHCLDCWEYNGQCATFACQEKRYVLTQTSVTQEWVAAFRQQRPDCKVTVHRQSR